jgi:hypothetical protein
MDMKKLLEDMRQDHDIEMAILNSKLSAGIPPSPLELASAEDSLVDNDEPTDSMQGATIQRDVEGNVISVNGRMVMRDEAGNIIGLQ